jgi:hypothetical protein
MSDVHHLERYVYWANLFYFLFAFLSILAATYVASRAAKVKVADYKRFVNSVNLLAFCSLVAAGTAIWFGNSLAKLKEADFNIRMAEASERIKVLDNEKTVLRTDLQSAIAKSRRSEAELAAQQTKLARAQKELAEAHKQLAEAQQNTAEAQLILEKTLQAVRERQTPRTFTPQQRSLLLRKLRSGIKGNFEIECPAANSEAYAYAMEFKALLKAADWPAGESGMNFLLSAGAIPKGVILVVRDAERAPRFVVTLTQAFNDAGIRVQLEQDANLGSEVALRIGEKP